MAESESKKKPAGLKENQEEIYRSLLRKEIIKKINDKIKSNDANFMKTLKIFLSDDDENFKKRFSK